MFHASAALHTLIGKNKHWAKILIALDCSGIFVVIAAIYTPVLLHASCYIMLAFQWGSVCIGIERLHKRLFRTPQPRVQASDASQSLHMILQAAAFLVVREDLRRCLSETFMWHVYAGCAWAGIGLPFFLVVSHWEFGNVAWHVCVLLASCCIFHGCYEEFPGK